MQATHWVVQEGTVGTSAAVIAGAWLAVSVAVVLAVAHRWWRARSAAEAAEQAERGDAARALAVGAATIVGVVETDDERPAIVLRLIEVGTEEQSRQGWVHEWREKDRVIEARPFTLRTAKGEAVLVEPGNAPRVIDDLHVVGAARVGEQGRVGERSREARVEHGETVRASGTLERGMSSVAGGYRGGEGGWRLVPPSGGAMLVSSKPLGDVHRSWASFYFVWTLLVLVLSVGAQVMVGYDYYPLMIAGRPAELEAVRLSETDSGRRGQHVLHHTAVLLGPGDHAPLHVPLAEGEWQRLHAGDLFAVVQTADGAHVQLGEQPSIDAVLVTLISLAGLGVLGAILLARASQRRWWERVPLVTQGTGRLSEASGDDEPG